MDQSIKDKIINKFCNGDIKTDSDLIDIAEDENVSTSIVERIIFDFMARNTSCENCKYLYLRFNTTPGYPCNKCSRINKTQDYYEPINDTSKK